MNNNINTVLIDGDILAYQVAFRAQKMRTEEIDGVKLLTPMISKTPDEIKDDIAGTLQAIKDDIFTNKDSEIYVSGSGNFREQVATIVPYKGTRDPNAKPIAWPMVRSLLETEFGATVVEGMEADDMLAIRATEEGGNAIIASCDKDLLQVPAYHYYWGSGKVPKRLTFKVSEEEAELNFLHQLLIGDTTDCIPGLHRIGKVRARAFLDERKGLPYRAIVRDIVDFYAERECKLSMKIPTLCGMTYDISTGKVFYLDRHDQERVVDIEDIVSEIGALLRMKRSVDEPIWNVNYYD